MGPVKSRMLLRRMRRQIDDTEKAKKIGVVLASSLGVELFGEELQTDICREFGDGSILERLGELFEWIMEHQDEIMELIELIIKIIGMFG